jgi:hypothetical protein
MRRTLTALTLTALASGALVALPETASAEVAPRLVSVSVSPGSVTTVGEYGKDRVVKVTVVYDDPDRVIRNAAFSNNGPQIQTYSPKDFSSVDAGSRRTFTGEFTEDWNSRPGKVTVHVEGQVGYGDRVPGTVGTTSYVVRNKPKIDISGTRSISYIWGKKSALTGNLSSTPLRANQKVTVQFKAKGTKKFKKKQVVRTDADGFYLTKKFKIDRAGTWRAVFKAKGYVLGAKGTFKVKNPYR